MDGCEELEEPNKPNYIQVTKRCQATVFHEKTWGTEEAVPNAFVRIEIIKAGGERKSDLFTTNSNGFTDTIETTFILYKEQKITCIACVVLTSVEQNLNHTWNSASESLPWDTFYPTYDFGSSTSKYIQLPVFGTQFNML